LSNYGMDQPLPLLNNLDFEREQLRQVEERLAALTAHAEAEEPCATRGVAVGDEVHGDKVGGDKVAGDKVVVSTHVRDVHGSTVITAGGGVSYTAGAAGDELSAVFAAFLQELQARADLSPQDKAAVEREVKALEATLKSDEPDLGTVQRVKRFFKEKGGWLATAGLALLSNPSVVAVVQEATKKLMGG